jgi:hypothetical protein
MNSKSIRAVVFVSVGVLALVGLLLWLGAAPPVWADPDTRYVASDGDDSKTCDSISNRCRTIQRAIDVSDPGDEIYVSGGTYTSAIGTVAVITKELVLEGGYSSPDFVFDPDLYQTVLDAQWGGSVISITDAGDVLLHHLTLTHGDGAGNCFSGGCGGGIYATGTSLHVGFCVITNNVANSPGATGTGYGGGIYAYANNQLVEVWDSQIVSNTANADPSSSSGGSGGGMYISGGTVSLRENQVLDNVGHVSYMGSGGGIDLETLSSAEVLTNTIRGNKAATSEYSSYGGGLLLYNSSAVTVAGNHIEDNWTNPTGGSGYGAGVLVWYSDAHLTRNTIISNSMGITAIPFGKGVYIESITPVTLSNNLIARNAADVYGGAVYVGRYSSPASQALLVNNTIADNGGSGVVAQWYAVVTMTNNLIVTHTVGLTNTHPASSTVFADTNLFWNTSDPITGTNAILEDPLLTADYHPGSGSPAIDAGLTIPWLTVDLEGNPRPQGSGYDIGAFEEVEGKVYLPLILKGY